MVVLVYSIDKTYGGRHYVEIDNDRKAYKTGNTRAHSGYYPSDRIEVEVATRKALRDVIQQVSGRGYTDETNSFNGRV